MKDIMEKLNMKPPGNIFREKLIYCFLTGHFFINFFVNTTASFTGLQFLNALLL